MRTTPWLVAIAGVGLLRASGGTAEACSCQPLPLWVAPGPQQVEVPSNLSTLHVKGIHPIGSTIELVDSGTGANVRLGPVVLAEGYFAFGLGSVAVLDPLVPGHAYTLQVSSGGDPSVRLAAFTVAATADTTAPSPITLESARVAIADFGPTFGSSCSGPIASFGGVVIGLDNAALVHVRFTAIDGTVTDRLLQPEASAFTQLGDESCSLVTRLARGATYDLAVSVIDLAGNESVPTHQSLTVGDCGELHDYPDVAIANECTQNGGPPVTSGSGDGSGDDANTDGFSDVGGDCQAGPSGAEGRPAPLGLLAPIGLGLLGLVLLRRRS